ncbi:probable serine/threonine-protein kinase PBL21 [Tanacetum coccineum]
MTQLKLWPESCCGFDGLFPNNFKKRKNKCSLYEGSVLENLNKEKVTDSKRGKGLVVRSNVANSFAFHELVVATHNFKDANLIGEGGFRSVYKGWLESRKVVAVKQLNLNSLQGH